MGKCDTQNEDSLLPGLGRSPAAFNVDIDDEGKTVGLF
jgi:formyltetrahydrofolate synthetase